MFKKAEKAKSKMRIALQGPAGAGKTYSALGLATGLGGKIAVIDTERGSASLYSDKFEFDVMELNAPFTPEAYIKAIEAAETAGYDVLVIDSITHEWNGKGGVIELVDVVAQKFKGNTWSAWSELTPRHRAFIDRILQSKMHVIVTMRSKMETAQVEKNGRKAIEKLGTKAEQKDDIEYEFTTVFDLLHGSHFAVQSKDRTGLFNKDPILINEKIGEDIKKWCETGRDAHQKIKLEIGSDAFNNVRAAYQSLPNKDAVLTKLHSKYIVTNDVLIEITKNEDVA